LINFILSQGEEFSYDLKNFKINELSKTYKLLSNKSHPNFFLLDVNSEKKTINISQVRELILSLNKTSFNSKPRFILIDNIEFMNTNSINALLKILEEPNQDIFFILIHNNMNILSTLKSRCLNFKISLPYTKSMEVINNLFDDTIDASIKNLLVNHYITPGYFLNLLEFLRSNNIDIKNQNLKNILFLIIDQSLFKKEISYKYIMYELLEVYLTSKRSIKDFELYKYFVKKISQTKKFNLDEESLFLEFKMRLINE
jgi:DNA polymerase-3 subunit delta'